MQTVPLQLNDVIYNAATQSFEALVTVHDTSGSRRYACSINAPITMEFEEASKGLSTQALRRHKHGQADSTFKPAVAPQRAGRLQELRSRIRAQFAFERPHAA